MEEKEKRGYAPLNRELTRSKKRISKFLPFQRVLFVKVVLLNLVIYRKLKYTHTPGYDLIFQLSDSLQFATCVFEIHHCYNFHGIIKFSWTQ